MESMFFSVESTFKSVDKPYPQEPTTHAYTVAIVKSDATLHLASRGMSGLGAVVCSWEDEGGVTVSDLTLSDSWATKTMSL